MLLLLQDNPQGIVVKPNEGTGGEAVFKVRSKPELERAVAPSSHRNEAFGLAVPGDRSRSAGGLSTIVPIVVYSKNRPSVVGDGKRSLVELALATIPAEALSAVLPGMVGDLDQAALDAIPAAGQRRALNWRHN